MTKAVLLDRDGTIVEEINYLHEPAKAVLERRVAPALQKLHQAGYLLVLITNQSGIGRGLFTEDDFRAVNARIEEMLAPEGIPIAGVYFCPHHPTEAQGDFRRACDCRKPQPGMLRAAIRDHGLDPEQCFMVGDHLKDVQAGQAVGIRSVLLRTGHGAEHADNLGDVRPDFIAEDLYDAVVSYIQPEPGR